MSDQLDDAIPPEIAAGFEPAFSAPKVSVACATGPMAACKAHVSKKLP